MAFTRHQARLVAEELYKLIRKDIQAAIQDMVVEECDTLMSVKEAAELLGKSPRTIYNNIETIPHVKVGKHLRFSKNALMAYINRQ